MNDISLIRLNSPVSFGSRVGAACLPSAPVPTNRQILETVGYGMEKTGEQVPTSDLQRVRSQKMKN